MSKVQALLATLVIGLSSTAMAAPRSASFHADARVAVQIPSLDVRFNTGGPVIRDHRTEQHFSRTAYDPRDQRNQRVDVSGTYNSNFGVVTLRQRGNRVTGSYITNEGTYHGTIEGIVENGVIRYQFAQPAQQGFGVWFVNRSNRIEGTWGTNGSMTNGGSWTLFAR